MKRNYTGNYNAYSPIAVNKTIPPPAAISPAAIPVRPYFQPDFTNRSTFTHIPPPSVPPPPVPQQVNSGLVAHSNYYVQRTPYQTGVQWRTPQITQLGGIGTPPRRWPPNMINTPYTPRPTPQQRKKQKKKTISQNVKTRVIKIEEAEAALKCENEHTATSKQLVIRFPDPPIDRDTVLNFNPAIRKVHFQQPSTPRYCFIQLNEDADTEKVIEEMRKIKFGMGHLRVELKHDANDRRDKPEDIDPYILFVGNIGQNTPAETIKQLFHPGRVDIGPSQKVKNSRYAYVKFSSAHEAIEVFKRTQGIMVGDHSLNVRFRRINGSIGLPGDKKTQDTSKKNQSQPSNQTADKTNQPSTQQEKNSDHEKQLASSTGENDMTSIVKKEESGDDYEYYEQPEAGDEIDIKMKHEYYNENAAYYIEQPEIDYEYDNDYFYGCEDFNNSNSPSSFSNDLNNDFDIMQSFKRSRTDSTLSSMQESPVAEDEMDDNEFLQQLSSNNREKSNNNSTTLTENSKGLGHSIKQIHLPLASPVINTNTDKTPENNSNTTSDQIHIKLEPKTSDQSTVKLKENSISNQDNKIMKIESKQTSNSTTNFNNLTPGNYIVKIPREKIQINQLSPSSNNLIAGMDDVPDDEQFADELEAILKKSYN